MEQGLKGNKADTQNLIQMATLNHLSINQIEFNNKSENVALKFRHLKPVLPTKIYHHGYNKVHNKNKKILP